MTTTTQAVSFDALLGALLMHQHQVTVITADTEVNLLAMTPAAGALGYATDTGYFYYFDGSAWKSSALPMGTTSAGVDIGALRYRDDSGYSPTKLSNKELHSAVIRGFTEGVIPLEPGAIRFVNPAFQVYVGGAWKNVRVLSDTEIADIQLWSQVANLIGDVDAYGHTVLKANHQVDIGAFGYPELLVGGEF